MIVAICKLYQSFTTPKAYRMLDTERVENEYRYWPQYGLSGVSAEAKGKY
jgi:hypothetical protein